MKTFRVDLHRVEEIRKNRRRSFWLWTLVSLVLICLVGFIAVQRYFYHDAPNLPEDINVLWSIGKEPSFVLLDKNGDVLATRGPHYSQIIPMGDIPEHVVQAFLAIEDQRFFEHDGVDKKGIIRAAFTNLQAGHIAQGGSTITQQIVKLLLLNPEQSIKRKLHEMRLARKLEKRLSKDDILTLYLNRIYFGNRAYGITAAAERYFQKPVTELNLSEAAMLAALPKAPSRFAPHLHPEQAAARAKIVLATMVEAGFIREDQRVIAIQNPALPLPSIEREPHGYIFDLATQRAMKFTGGRIPALVITTTIDPKLQAIADGPIVEMFKKEGVSRNATQLAMITTDHSGAVRALVGGVSYETSQFNRAVSAKRQPGSAFKAFVYAAALEVGIRSTSIRRDEPIEIAGWSPGNYDGGYRGRVTFREAFRRSINTVAAQVTDEIGAHRVASLATRFGVSGPLEGLPSIALGAQEVTLWDLTQAFAVFANTGNLQESYLIEKITSSRGDVLFQRPELPPRRVFDEAHAQTMTSMMQEVVLAGTGRAAQIPGRQVAGKTGTSQQWRDAWFVGYSAQMTTGVWVGNDDNSSMSKVTGGQLPAKVWAMFMRAAHDGLPIKHLQSPAPQLLSEVDEGRAAYYRDLALIFGALETTNNVQ